MSDVSLGDLSVDTGTLDPFDHPARRTSRRVRLVSPLLAKYRADDRVGDRVTAQRVGARYRVLVEYRLDGGRRVLRHESPAWFRTEAEALDRGAHYLAQQRAKEVTS